MYNITFNDKKDILGMDQAKMFAPFLNINEDISLVKNYLNPLRDNKEDHSKGCFFSWHKGKLWFIDFASQKTHYDIFDVVMQSQGVNFQQSIDILSNYIVDNNIPKGNVIQETTYELERTPILFATRSWEQRDRDYWKTKYGITTDQLESDNVHPVLWYKFFSKRNNKWIVIRPKDICYSIYFPNSGNCKIYRPLGSKEQKWLCNVSKDKCGGDEIIGGKDAIVTKSYKDYRVLKNQGCENVAWVQSENVSSNIVFDLTCKALGIRIFFDNDSAGVKFANNLVKELGKIRPNQVSSIIVPDRQTKDASDYFEKYGNVRLRNLCKIYGLINLN